MTPAELLKVAGVVKGEPADAVEDTEKLYEGDGHFEPWERDEGCEHDRTGAERCLVAHWVNGIPQGQCERCRKCGRWVPAPLVTESPLPAHRPAALLWMPDGSGRS